MVHETGKTVAEADPEVSEAVDFARYYADRAADLADGVVPGAVHRPAGLTVVTPPWNFPVAIPVGSVLASLAAGQPGAGQAGAAGAAVRAGRDGGDPARARRGRRTRRRPHASCSAPRETSDGGSSPTPTSPASSSPAPSRPPQLFAGWRADLDVLAETSGKNALVITPSADVDLAVADLVRSAFGHAGQKCSAASLAILVGSAGRSDRLRRQLADAVASLRVGPATDLGTAVGPLTEPASGKLLRALTTLDPGESWLVAPRQLDDEGRLWSPGVKFGVAPGSWFHTTECFGPVLGIMRVETLDEAIDLQNAVAFGLTGGLHSLDEAEIDHWLDRVEVGNAYVNRHITGAIVQRQPFGGWKASTVGPGAKAGGPHYVAQIGDWQDSRRRPAGRRRLARLGAGRRRPRVGRRALARARPVRAARRGERPALPARAAAHRPDRRRTRRHARSTGSATPRATAGVRVDRERRVRRVPRGVRGAGPLRRRDRPRPGGRVGAGPARGRGHPRRRRSPCSTDPCSPAARGSCSRSCASRR